MRTEKDGEGFSEPAGEGEQEVALELTSVERSRPADLSNECEPSGHDVNVVAESKVLGVDDGVVERLGRVDEDRPARVRVLERALDAGTGRAAHHVEDDLELVTEKKGEMAEKVSRGLMVRAEMGLWYAPVRDPCWKATRSGSGTAP